MRALFIYWKVSPEHGPAAQAAARAFQASLVQRQPTLEAGLYRRAEPDSKVLTLMETYAQPGGLDAAVEREIIEQGQTLLAAWCQGLRHVEPFDRLIA